jgi:hypothetical protein
MVPIPATYTMVIWGGTFVPWYMVMVHCTMVTMVLVPWCTAPNYHGAGTMVEFDLYNEEIFIQDFCDDVDEDYIS